MDNRTDQNDPTMIANFEDKGQSQVRLMVAAGLLPPQMNLPALAWLKKKEAESRERIKELQDFQTRTAQSTKKASWIAAAAAMCAVGLAIIGILLQWLTWHYPHN